MSRPRGALAVVSVTLALASAALSLGAPAAYGQSRYPPEPVDVDQASERQSRFWDKLAHPERSRYLGQISQAEDYLRDDNPESVRRAERALESAIAIAPDDPYAHWALAGLYERNERWRECADAYDRAFALDPGFRPPDQSPKERALVQREAAWDLDYGTAVCHAQAGEFERAITHYKRIPSRGVSRDGRVYRGLGDVYMALGRLGEAIDAYEIALSRGPSYWQVYYALAVAHDRNEQAERATEALRQALRHDPTMSALEAPGARYVPAIDSYYYLALAHDIAGEPEAAIAYFRHYIAEADAAGQSPWTRRARDHLRELERQAIPLLDSIKTSDKGLLGQDLLERAVAPLRPQLHACLVDTPDLLLSVRIVLAVTQPRRPKRAPVRVAGIPGGRAETPGVHATVLYSFSTPPERIAQAVECLEAQADKITWPPIRSEVVRYLTVSFPVISPR